MGENGRKRTWLVLASATFLLALVLAVFYNRQQIIDQIAVWKFQPSSEVAQLAMDSGMSGGGEFYFYASQPQLDNRDTFNENCSDKEAQAIILGCYASQRIYIYNVTDEKIAGVKSVTAAHEMLHAAYERLSSGEKAKVNKMIEDQLSSTTDKRVLDLVALYDKVEPGQRLNELHSIFGTEVANLSSGLENYYGKYFSDRQKVVREAEKYQSVFDQLQAQQDALVSQLESLKAEIEQLTDNYNTDMDQLSQEIDEFNNRAAVEGGFSSQAEFDDVRATLVNRQNQLNDLADTINEKINEYNDGVNQLNALGAQAQKLQNNLNSRSEEIE